MNILIIQMHHMDPISTAYYLLANSSQKVCKIFSYVNGYKCRLNNKYLSILESFKVVILFKNDVQFY